MSNLTNNTTELQLILEMANSLPDAGVKLPALSNPGTSEQLAEGYELIDQDGNKVTGTHVCSSGDMVKAIIERTITEINDDTIEEVGDAVFRYCESLVSAVLPNITYIGWYGFANCTSLTVASFPKVTSTNTYAFYGCDGMITVELPLLTEVRTGVFKYAFQTSNAEARLSIPSATSIGNNGVQQCYQLRYIDAPLVTSIGEYCFSECYCLHALNMPNLTAIPLYSCQWCEALTSEDFLCLTNIATGGFSNCTSLETLILRSDTVVTLANINAFTNTPIANGVGYVYVPSALLTDYQAATNWATYAAQFRALEDYTVDGTITGELDTAKI